MYFLHNPLQPFLLQPEQHQVEQPSMTVAARRRGAAPQCAVGRLPSVRRQANLLPEGPAVIFGYNRVTVNPVCRPAVCHGPDVAADDAARPVARP